MVDGSISEPPAKLFFVDLILTIRFYYLDSEVNCPIDFHRGVVNNRLSSPSSTGSSIIMGLKKTLKGRIPDSDLTQLVKSFDIIGDIAVLIVPEQLRQYERIIADALFTTHRNVKTVLRRDGTYGGEHRVIQLAHIAGEQKTATICTEFGVRLKLDLQEVYFSVRLGNERKRIADQVRPGEEVLVLFSGIAPYPLMIARYSLAESITGVELNERAHAYGETNLQLNKVNNIRLVNEDAHTFLEQTQERYHRIIMPLPSKSAHFLEAALMKLRSGGFVHYYEFRSADRFDASVELIARTAASQGKSVASFDIVVCGHNSPTSYRICVDARIV